MKRTLFPILFSLFCFYSQAQIRLHSSGIIPEDIFSSTTLKYELKKAASLDSSYNEPRSVRLFRLKFYETSFHTIDAIKNNAGIYINDSYTQLLNQIADELLKNQPDVRNKIHLYAYRSPYVNAFSTDQGDIFFTIGLLAHLQNESELAFVVGHEIVHYLKQHNTAGLDKIIKITREKEKDTYNGISVEDEVEKYHQYSRELEKEADLIAIDLLKESRYNLSSCLSALDMLGRSHLGFEEKSIDLNLLMHGYSLPETLQPHKIPKTEVDTTDDEESTHPSLYKRILYVKDKLQNVKGHGDRNFLFVTESDFYTLRDLARKQQAVMFCEKGYFAKAIYNASLLYGNNKDSSLSELIKVRYYRAVQEILLGLDMPETEDDLYSGELYRIHYLIYGLKKPELLVTHFFSNWYAYKESRSEFDKALATQALKWYIKNAPDEWDVISRDNFDSSRIKNRKFYDAALEFHHISGDSLFINAFGRLSEIELNFLKEHNEAEKKDHKDNNGPDTIYNLKDLNRMIVLNPFYMRFDEKIDDYLDFEETYQNEPKFLNAIQMAALHNGIEPVMLDVRFLSKEQADYFDDISGLTQMIGSMLRTQSKPEEAFYPISKSYLNDLRSKYNTPYVMVIGAEAYRGVALKRKMVFVLNFFSTALIPFTILKFFQTEREVEIYYVIINIDTQKVVRTDKISFSRMIDNQNVLNVYVNDLISKIE